MELEDLQQKRQTVIAQLQHIETQRQQGLGYLRALEDLIKLAEEETDDEPAEEAVAP